MTRFAIVDQNATSNVGHYFTYTCLVADSAIRQNLDVEIWANTKNPFHEEYFVRPIFTQNWTDIDHDHQKSTLFDMLYSTIQASAFKADDIIFVHSIGPNELNQFLCSLSQIEKQLPVLLIMLRYDVFWSKEEACQVASYIKKITQYHTVQFVADTQQISEKYELSLGCEVRHLPIPIDTLLCKKISERYGTKNIKPCFAYLGDARMEKNYHRLPEAISALWASYLVTEKLCFLLQSNFNSPKGDAGFMGVREKLTAFGEEHVRLVYGPFNTAEYLQFMSGVDVVLLPYHSGQYANRSSGILIEAMAMEKPVIVTKDSWLASVVDDTHAVVIDDPGQLADGIKFAYDTLDNLKAGAAIKADQILKQHRPDIFLTQLLNSFNHG